MDLLPEITDLGDSSLDMLLLASWGLSGYLTFLAQTTRTLSSVPVVVQGRVGTQKKPQSVLMKFVFYGRPRRTTSLGSNRPSKMSRWHIFVDLSSPFILANFFSALFSQWVYRGTRGTNWCSIADCIWYLMLLKSETRLDFQLEIKQISDWFFS